MLKALLILPILPLGERESYSSLARLPFLQPSHVTRTTIGVRGGKGALWARRGDCTNGRSLQVLASIKRTSCRVKQQGVGWKGKNAHNTFRTEQVVWISY